MTNITENKRAYERFDLEVPARMGILGSAKEKMDEVSLTTTNICAGGAFLITEAFLPPGTRVKMDFTLSIDKLRELLDSNRSRIKVEGEVIRTDETGIAVRFDEEYEIIPVKEVLH